MSSDNNFTFSKRKSVSVPLDEFCLFSADTELEVCEWANMEGFDIYITKGSNSKTISFTWGEYDALKFAIEKVQEYHTDD